MLYRCQLGAIKGRQGRIVEPGDGYLLRNLDAVVHKAVDGANCHVIGCRNDCSRQFPGLQNFFHCRIGIICLEITAFHLTFVKSESAVCQGILKPFQLIGTEYIISFTVSDQHKILMPPLSHLAGHFIDRLLVINSDGENPLVCCRTVHQHYGQIAALKERLMRLIPFKGKENHALYLFGFQQLQIAKLLLDIPVGIAQDHFIIIGFCDFLKGIEQLAGIVVCNIRYDNADKPAFFHDQAAGHRIRNVPGLFNDIKNPFLNFVAHWL